MNLSYIIGLLSGILVFIAYIAGIIDIGLRPVEGSARFTKYVLMFIFTIFAVFGLATAVIYFIALFRFEEIATALYIQNGTNLVINVGLLIGAALFALIRKKG